MEIIIGIIAYVVILIAFMAFGKFLRECDNDMAESMRRHPEASERKEADQ